MIYQSHRTFKVWSYTVSHSSLLIRSIMKFIDEDDFSEETSYNIDIEFWSVTFIGIPSTLKNLKIKEISEDLLPAHVDSALCKYKQKIFEISEESKKYYVIAGGLLIGVNKWVNEDRISNYDLNLEHDKVIVKI